mmetsp:Transcript_33157/g.83590  ORF Transcript_33157/g.83590 Transcript_33157/m.83590 type:complete len:245 (-) Transcript_33157:3-737(-)
MTSMLEVSSRATLHDSIVILTALSTVKGVAAFLASSISRFCSAATASICAISSSLNSVSKSSLLGSASAVALLPEPPPPGLQPMKLNQPRPSPDAICCSRFLTAASRFCFSTFMWAVLRKCMITEMERFLSSSRMRSLPPTLPEVRHSTYIGMYSRLTRHAARIASQVNPLPEEPSPIVARMAYCHQRRTARRPWGRLRGRRCMCGMRWLCMEILSSSACMHLYCPSASRRSTDARETSAFSVG